MLLFVALWLNASPGDAPASAPLLEAERSRKVDAVWFSAARGQVKGGTAEATVYVKPNPAKEIRVGVYEELSGGAGEQWRTAVWMSSFVAATTVGRQLTDYEFAVAAGDQIDGPSAGALLTAATIAAILDAKVDPKATMTGAINPDGTIGPVGGIAQKIAGAAASGKKLFGYPLGQRYDLDLSTGKLVDLHAVASANHLKARELRDVYDAYALLTGQALVRPTPSEAVELELPPQVFKRFEASTLAWLQRARANIDKLSKTQLLPLATAPLLAEAESKVERALRYQMQGMAAAAYQKAIQAALASDLAIRFDDIARIGLKKGDVGALARAIAGLMDIGQDVEKAYASLGAVKPKTANGAMALMSAQSAVVTAWTFAQMANEDVEEYDAVVALLRKGLLPAGWKARLEAAGGPQAPQALSWLLTEKLMGPAIYYLSAAYMLERAKEMLAAQPDSGAPLSLDAVTLTRLAKSYASAAKANLDYYDRLVTSAEAEKQGLSLAMAREAKAASNYDYRVARTMLAFAVARRKDEGVGPAIGAIAAGLGAWLRAASLVASEYSLGVKRDARGRTVVEREKALASMLELAELKAREHASVARATVGEVPIWSRFDYLGAKSDREGDVQEKLDALFGFWRASATCQMAAQLKAAEKRATAAGGHGR